jgi:hypothetical protein
MTTFTAQGHARTRCAECGTLRHAHDDATLACPSMYRPDNLDDARTELVDAIESGDQTRVFVARGNLQRLGGRP